MKSKVVNIVRIAIRHTESQLVLLFAFAVAVCLAPCVEGTLGAQASRSNPEKDQSKSGKRIQSGDKTFNPTVRFPKYGIGKGPVVLIDEAHHNFHTREGRYAPFAKLLEADGFQVHSNRKPFSRESLNECNILVISNPVHRSNIRKWELPTQSAFTDKEMAALVGWIHDGGSLLLIADHMPFAGSANALAKRLGANFDNGFVFPKEGRGKQLVFERCRTLASCHRITLGECQREQIDSVATFTGSAFLINHCFVPIFTLPQGSYSLAPRVAWQFDDETRKTQVGGWSQGAVRNFGMGRVAIFGEAAMFTAQTSAKGRPIGMSLPIAKDNKQFALNLLHWLANSSK